MSRILEKFIYYSIENNNIFFYSKYELSFDYHGKDSNHVSSSYLTEKGLPPIYLIDRNPYI
jgi:hypothetical protein